MKRNGEYGISSRLLFRGKLFLDRINDSWSKYVRFKMSRDEANRIKEKVISASGRKIVDRRLKKRIMEYCRETFGSASYWPWLALYTELRGEFKEGWIPDDYYRFELLPRLNPKKFMRFSEAKILDHKLFGEIIIEPVLFRTNGHYYDNEGIYKTKDEVKKMLNIMDSEIIIKPDAGRSGQGIIFKYSKDLDLENLNSHTDLLFQKVVKQHSELSRLYPHSVNTLRVFTFINRDGIVKTKFINLRFGRGGSRVDNTGSGGGWTLVQLNGKVESNAYDKIGRKIGDKHPDTGIKFLELNIPSFKKTITLCENAHRRFPYTRIIGWDVFIDENEEPKLIEWNANNPGFWDSEALFGPFFSELLSR